MWSEIHLVVTHFPPVLTVGSTLCAAAAMIMRRRRDDLVRVALGLVIATAGLMPLTYVAGDRTAEKIGRVEGVQQEAIAPHQQAAKIALIVSIASASIAVALLLLTRTPRLATRVLTLAISLLSFVIIGWTAHLGGQIHHPELGKLTRNG